MIKKTITYTDYNDVERTETFYFGLNKAEIIEMEMGVSGGLSAMLQKIVDSKDAPSIIKTFKDLILKAYGEKSADGKHFVKSEELSKAFSQTEAYSSLYMELAFNTAKASEFVNGIMPKDMLKDIPKNVPEPTNVTPVTAATE